LTSRYFFITIWNWNKSKILKNFY